MKTVNLDGLKMLTRADAFKVLKRELALPEHCGNNLDAIWDCLTELSEPIQVNFAHSEDMVEALAPYGVKLLQTLIEASIKNPNFKLVIEWSPDEDEENE